MLSPWRYRDLPIQRKITLIIVIGMASAMFVTVANFIVFDRDNVKRDLSEEMRVLARITAARSAAAVAFDDRVNARENLAVLAIRSTVQFACIYDGRQQLFAAYHRRSGPDAECLPVLDPAAADHADHQLLVVTEPITRRGRALGLVLVASDLSPIEVRTRKWIVTSFLVTLAALLMAFLMTRRLQHSVVQPIIDLSTVMDRVRRSNDLSLRAQAHGQDEVGRLVDSFNDMLKIVDNNHHDLQRLYRGLVEKSAEAEATAASLEVSNQRIKDLFGSAAHDLRQPLQAMAIFVDTLRKKTRDAEQLAILEKLKQAMQNLSSLFVEILDVSRYDFDLSVAGTQPTSIKQLLSKVYLEFEALAQQKGLKIRFHSGNYTVLAHGALLERIIRNLLSNAIRYTDQGGILLGCRRRGDWLAIEIWDTGRGIPANKQEQIFSKFVQVSDEDREKRGGFGLGLAIVRQFVDSLGYDLTLRSSVGKGSVFRLMVPLVSAKDSDGGETAPVHHDRPMELLGYDVSLDELSQDANSRVLLVDDNDAVRDGLKMLLKSWGFAVDAVDGIAALEALFRRGCARPDLVISDFQLSASETGDAAIARACELWQSELPAFIVSGAETAELWQTIAATGYPALRKPVKPARLRAMINHLMR